MLNKNAIVVRVQAWLQLFRVPNLLTVPGDPIVGVLLASLAPVSPVLLLVTATASLAFYMAGLALNDFMDLEVDRPERPDRPLPSGRIPPVHAVRAALSLMGLGLLLCIALGPVTMWIGVALAATVAGYNRWLKHVPVAGPLGMGLCRGLSVLLGASAVGVNVPALVLAVVVTLYIAGVTQRARHEVRTKQAGLIGHLIAALLLIQALGALTAGYPVIAVALALCWPLNRLLARYFYAS